MLINLNQGRVTDKILLREAVNYTDHNTLPIVRDAINVKYTMTLCMVALFSTHVYAHFRNFHGN